MHGNDYKEWMVSTYERIIHKVERFKFQRLMQKVSDNRKLIFMQNLEEMQQRNQGLPGVNSRTRFQDFNTKFEKFNKQNLFNVSNLVQEKVVKKPVVKKMTQN